MRAEKRKNFQDLVEEEEEDVGLAFPPFDEEDFMAAEASYFDLSEELFFSSVHDDRKSAERFEGSSGNLSAVQIKQKRHGKGKDMKVLEEVYRHKDINACKDTNTETKAKIIESKKTSTKAAIGDGVSQEEEKINLAKRKFHERYEQIAKEKKRKQIQVLSISELPKVPREKCRPVKYRSGFTPKFKSFAEEEEEEEEEDVGLACPPFDEEDFMAAKASYSDLSEEVFFSRIDNDQKSSEIPVEDLRETSMQYRSSRKGMWNVLDRPWEFHKLFITASRFSYAVGSVKRSHVLIREGNCMADALAKEGLNRIGGLVLTSHTFQVD
ncbi:hypothetical protein H0E87_003400 [Populus deltoides]|uniref:Uncharacterized protein n=1 Tax=Populus deltoides TaxID=3696 RepID=A0A8T2ZYX0_POPDE|nr:hypothetical protein H0E87_003400 [Populus deltoides]